MKSTVTYLRADRAASGRLIFENKEPLLGSKGENARDLFTGSQKRSISRQIAMGVYVDEQVSH
jgi:hypothetical protein